MQALPCSKYQCGSSYIHCSIAMCIIESNASSDLKQEKHQWCFKDQVRKILDHHPQMHPEKILVSECAMRQY